MKTAPEDVPRPRVSSPISRPVQAVLFVCTQNVCRSIAAEEVFRYLSENAGLAVKADSAGTHAAPGRMPDPNLCAVAALRGYDFLKLRSRPFTEADCERFDLILAADAESLRFVQRLAQGVGKGVGKGAGKTPRTGLLADYSRAFDIKEIAFPADAPGSVRGYAGLLDQIEDACLGLLKDLRSADTS